MDKLHIFIGSEPWHRAASLFLRMQVFVLEGKIAIEDEFDENDGENTVYALAFDGNLPVSTNRLVIENQTTVRITRVATLNEYRHRGIASKLLTTMEAYIAEHNFNEILIHSEIQALPFYLVNGYEIASEPYLEDGVPCQTVRKMS